MLFEDKGFHRYFFSCRRDSSSVGEFMKKKCNSFFAFFTGRFTKNRGPSSVTHIPCISRLLIRENATHTHTYIQEANRLKKISRVFHEQREANGVVVVVVVVWIVNIHCRLIHRLVSSSVVENTFFECKMLKNAGVQTRRVYWLPSTPGQRNVKNTTLTSF